MKNIRTLFCIGLFFITMTVNASIIMGNPKGNVTLVEVMSYQCIHCHNMQFVLETLQTETPALKMKIFPVANDQLSLLQATSSLALAKQNITWFEAYHRALLERAFTETQTYEYLKTLPIDHKLLEEDMHTLWVRDDIMQGLNLLNVYQSGTPLLIIYATDNPEKRRIFRGEASLAQLKQAIMDVQ